MTKDELDRLRTEIAHLAGVISIDQPYTGSFASIMECVTYGPIAIQIADRMADFLDAQSAAKEPSE